MKKILITLILATCTIFSSCGPGTAELYEFQSFDEFIEILDGRFMFPTYYPCDIDINNMTKDNVNMGATFLRLGKQYHEILFENFSQLQLSIVNSTIYENSIYHLSMVLLNFINYESSGYESRMYSIINSRSKEIKYHNGVEVYIGENILQNNSYEEIDKTYISNTYLIYKNDIPYEFALYVTLNSKDESIVSTLLPEINEMTYTEAMKMFDSLHPIE